ncbi:MAG: gamma-glutamylcyclotransferase [Pseudolabrys sp.]|nr:gamma-glutamylcyclotransferase [Pseudolabrys sp.]
MPLYFAYGSNMHRAAMQGRCREARAVGVATLAGYRFFIGVDGWGSVRREPGRVVHGVLWKVTPRDLAALHAYELLDKGLYDFRTLPVRTGARSVGAMIYLLRRRRTGTPKPGYAEFCAAAAREWHLPEGYVRSIERWSVSRWTGSRVIGVTDTRVTDIRVSDLGSEVG